MLALEAAEMKPYVNIMKKFTESWGDLQEILNNLLTESD